MGFAVDVCVVRQDPRGGRDQQRADGGQGVLVRGRERGIVDRPDGEGDGRRLGRSRRSRIGDT